MTGNLWDEYVCQLWNVSTSEVALWRVYEGSAAGQNPSRRSGVFLIKYKFF